MVHFEGRPQGPSLSASSGASVPVVLVSFFVVVFPLVVVGSSLFAVPFVVASGSQKLTLLTAPPKDSCRLWLVLVCGRCEIE